MTSSLSRDEGANRPLVSASPARAETGRFHSAPRSFRVSFEVLMPVHPVWSSFSHLRPSNEPIPMAARTPACSSETRPVGGLGCWGGEPRSTIAAVSRVLRSSSSRRHQAPRWPERRPSQRYLVAPSLAMGSRTDSAKVSLRSRSSEAESRCCSRRDEAPLMNPLHPRAVRVLRARYFRFGLRPTSPLQRRGCAKNRPRRRSERAARARAPAGTLLRRGAERRARARAVWVERRRDRRP